MKKLAAFLCFSVLCLTRAFPQTGGVTIYSPTQAMHMAEPLRAQAKASTGMASETLEKFPGHYTMLAYREKDGEVELHQQFADIMMIVDGSATLITGGTGENMKTTAPGELRGTSIRGGSSTKLEKGDFVRIPADTPHQMLVHPGDSITYLVVKIAKTDQ